MTEKTRTTEATTRQWKRTNSRGRPFIKSSRTYRHLAITLAFQSWMQRTTARLEHRLRFLLFGGRDGLAPAVLAPTHGDGAGLLPFQTVRNAIFDLWETPGPHSEYTPNVARYFSMVPPGGNWRDLPKNPASGTRGRVI